MTHIRQGLWAKYPVAPPTRPYGRESVVHDLIRISFFFTHLSACPQTAFEGCSERSGGGGEGWSWVDDLAVWQRLLEFFNTVLGDVGVTEIQVLKVGETGHVSQPSVGQV